MSEKLSTIDAAVEAIAQGRIVIVMDAEDRENEGDFICAAEKVTAGDRQLHDHPRPRPALHADPARGLPSGSTCRRWSTTTRPRWAPHFTVPVDHRSCRTGITAQERAMTILAIVDPASKPADFVRPGHLLPAGGQGRRRAAPGRPHRGRRRPGPAGRTATGRRALRNPRRQRRPRQPRRSSIALAERARPGDHHHRGADPLPPPQREARLPAWPRPTCPRSTARAG